MFHLLHPKLRLAIEELGYGDPTPAQTAAIPKILSGRHTLLVAPTGFGKTEAALFPVMSRLIEGDRAGVGCLYITPLRSLNRDLLRRLYTIAQRVGLTIAVRHGDTPESERKKLAQRPPDILVTTPETLQILLVQKFRRNLASVKHVIVDEVHELAGSKRGVQLALGLERLVELAGEFQRVGLSATVGNVELVAKFLAGERKVDVVEVWGDKKLEIEVVLPTPTEEDFVESEKLDATPGAVARIKKVAEYIERGGKVLVFTNTRDGAEFLTTRLRQLGVEVGVHHSSLSREHRVSIEEHFKSGELKAVVATSSLELGIDVGDVELVVQYGSPRQVSKLVQRIGRSGHKLGLTSRGVVIASDFEDFLESSEIVDRAVAKRLERDVVYHENALDVLLHQLIGAVLEARIDGKEMNFDTLLKIFKRAHPYRDLTARDLEMVVNYANNHKLLWGLRPRRGCIRYYFENVSTIPDEKSYRAIDKTTGRAVGELDREFVYAIEPGVKLILSGRVWTFSNREGDRVFLYPDYEISAALPAWVGEEIPVLYEVAKATCTRRRDILTKALRGELDVDLNGGLSEDLVPSPDRLHIHVVGGKYIVIHSCLGSRGNEALGLYLSHALSGHVGPVGYKSDPYRVLLITREFAPVKAVVELLEREEDFVYRTLRNAVRSSKMFRYRFLQVARRVGLISKDAEDIPHRLVEAYLDDLPGVEALREIFIEKLDLPPLFQLLNGVRSGEVAIVIHRLAKPTILESPILEEALRVDFAFRGLSREVLADLARRRILNYTATLLCLNCGSVYTSRAGALPEELSCGKCGMKTLAVVKKIDLTRAKLVLDKFKLRQKLTSEERKVVENLQQSALVVMQYGKLGVLAQLAHGVGPKTAVKILNRVLEGEDLWSVILDAERQYAATRAFWD